MKKTVIIHGQYISSLETFYDEIENELTKDLGWKTGRNLDAFNDLLRGGFGVYEYEEPFLLIWENSGYSKNHLGWEETIRYVKSKLKTCHPANTQYVEEDLRLAQQHKGQTLFEIIVDIIKSHEHIEFRMV